MVKIGIFTLDNEEILKMKDMLNKSSKEKVEYGANICVDPTKKGALLTIEGPCKGVGCRVLMPVKCTDSKILVGNFHTHLEKKTADTPSITDITKMVKYGMTTICIGSTQKDTINCYTRKTPKEIPHAEYLADLNIKTTKGLIKLNKKHSELREKYGNEQIEIVNNILKEQFDNIEI